MYGGPYPQQKALRSNHKVTEHGEVVAGEGADKIVGGGWRNRKGSEKLGLGTVSIEVIYTSGNLKRRIGGLKGQAIFV